ncbi:MFS general substrate transporter [Meredithblackwellia eburnea MCA 4105]
MTQEGALDDTKSVVSMRVLPERELQTDDFAILTIHDEATRTRRRGFLRKPKAPGSEILREIACNSSVSVAGWNDAAAGPLIPWIQSYYRISYTSVSMIFVGSMCGCVIAGLVLGTLNERIGMGRVITIGVVCAALGYSLLIPALPFPLFPVAYVLIGIGQSFTNSCANAYIASLPNSEHRLGYLHAAYGTGALVCPLAATAFVSAGHKFSYFYAISTGIIVSNLLFVLYAFKFSYREATVPADIELQPARLGEEPVCPRTDGSEKNIFVQTMSSRVVWIFSAFALIYVGIEVSIGGWIVTFMVEKRDGGASAGYIATGFWAGIALGRALLPRLNLFVGERRIVFVYLAIACSLEIAIWFSKNLIGNAVQVALVGVAIAPLYPIIISLITKILPRHLHASGIGTMSALGTIGSAGLPFATGALSQRYSPAALQPIAVAAFSIMTGIWLFVPRVDKRAA